MGAIDTEDAARRLARVILSDIDLYMRERPKAGESREAQIEEGRRLFASRVTPELVPVFAMVLADRAAGIVNPPVASRAPAIPASDPGPADPVPSSPAPADDERPTDPSIAAPSFEDEPPSVPVPVAPPVAPALAPPPLVARPAPDPPAFSAPAPIQRARVPMARLLAVASVVAAIAAVIYRFSR